MAKITKDDHKRMSMEHVLFAKQELERRKKAPVHVKSEEIWVEGREPYRTTFIVDPRIGWNNHAIRLKLMSTLVVEIDPGKRSGAHRHRYEEVNHVLAGEGYSIIEDKRYEWKKGDTLAIPLFSWHQHFNTGREPARFLVHTGRPAMENIGLMITQQGEVAT